MIGRSLAVIAMVGTYGYAFAQADRAPEVSCSAFLEMTSDEQTLAVTNAVAAIEGQAGDQQAVEDANEDIIAACTADPQLSLAAAIGQVTQN